MNADLVSRFSSTLDEIERVARAASPGPWRRHDTHLKFGGHTATVMSGEGNDTELRAWLPTFETEPWGGKRNVWNDSVHIALWDPQAVLRLVAATRELIEKYRTAQTTVDVSEGTVLTGAMKINQRARLEAIKILAAGFGVTEEDTDG